MLTSGSIFLSLNLQIMLSHFRRKATLRNKRKLAAVNRESQGEHPGNKLSRDTNVPRVNEKYITPALDEIDGRVTLKLSQGLSRIKGRNLITLPKQDEFLLQARTAAEFYR